MWEMRLTEEMKCGEGNKIAERDVGSASGENDTAERVTLEVRTVK